MLLASFTGQEETPRFTLAETSREHRHKEKKTTAREPSWRVQMVPLNNSWESRTD